MRPSVVTFREKMWGLWEMRESLGCSLFNLWPYFVIFVGLVHELNSFIILLSYPHELRMHAFTQEPACKILRACVWFFVPIDLYIYKFMSSLSRWKIAGHWQYGGVGFYGPLKETASCIREVLLGMHAGRVLSSTFDTRVLPMIYDLFCCWNIIDDWLIKTRWFIWYKGCKLF